MNWKAGRITTTRIIRATRVPEIGSVAEGGGAAFCFRLLNG
jgi:hypothetical protein